MSKWGWWDIQFSTWCLAELEWGVETSSLYMGLLSHGRVCHFEI